MGGARNISWGGIAAIDCGGQDLVVVVWAPSTYCFEHEHNCLGQYLLAEASAKARPRIKLNVSNRLRQIIES